MFEQHERNFMLVVQQAGKVQCCAVREVHCSIPTCGRYTCKVVKCCGCLRRGLAVRVRVA